MGLNNWMVQRALRSQAKRIADWAKETYPVVKAQHQGLPEQLVHQKMLGFDFSGLSPGAKHRIEECTQTIEGLCYLMADTSGATKGWAAFRCLQLTTHIDATLYERGFKRQTKDMKERILAALARTHWVLVQANVDKPGKSEHLRHLRRVVLRDRYRGGLLRQLQEAACVSHPVCCVPATAQPTHL